MNQATKTRMTFQEMWLLDTRDEYQKTTREELRELDAILPMK